MNMKKRIALFMSVFFTVLSSTNVWAADLTTGNRYTDTENTVLIQEGGSGVWKKGTTFTLRMENGRIPLEDTAKVWTDEESGMKIRYKVTDGVLTFTVEQESDTPAIICIDDLKLFLSRNLPSGTYRLELESNIDENFYTQKLFGAEDENAVYGSDKNKGDNFIGDVVKKKNRGIKDFVTVSIGLETDDLYTTYVEVPIGKDYLLANGKEIPVDAPAYISEEGYAMLPVRSVSAALGLDRNNVLWDKETQTVTILYRHRIISMTEGKKEIRINGSVIPAETAVTIKDGRAFLGLRDLGHALQIPDLSWDAERKTAMFHTEHAPEKA